MTERKRLTELLKEKQDYGVVFKESQMDDRFNFRQLIDNSYIADYLIENGVVVLPCKVGDTVYINTSCNNIIMGGMDELICPFENCCDELDCSYFTFDEGKVTTFETTIRLIIIDDTGIHIIVEDFSIDITVGDFGRTVFRNREEAEKALKKQEREGE